MRPPHGPTCPTEETNQAQTASEIGAEISAPVFVLAATPRTSRLVSPLPIALRQLHRPFEGLFPPGWTTQFGWITAQARYFPDLLPPGIAVPACPYPTFPYTGVKQTSQSVCHEYQRARSPSYSKIKEAHGPWARVSGARHPAMNCGREGSAGAYVVRPWRVEPLPPAAGCETAD